MAPGGKGQGGGQGRGQSGGNGQGQGRMGGRGGGVGGECVCLNCGTTMPHERGIPCLDVKCPKCGKMMTRK